MCSSASPDASHFKSLAAPLEAPFCLDLGDFNNSSHVVLNGKHLVVQHCMMVLLDGLESILRLLEDHSCGSKELTELVPVELAFLQFSDLLEKSL